MFSLMHGFTLNCVWLWTLKWLFMISTIQSSLLVSAVYRGMERLPARRVSYDPYHSSAAVPLSWFNLRMPRDGNIPFKEVPVIKEIFHIEPSDAVSKLKWSQRAVEHHHSSIHARHEKEKNSSLPKEDFYTSSSYPPLVEGHDFQISSNKKYSDDPLDVHFFRSTVNSVVKHFDEIDAHLTETPLLDQINGQSEVSGPQSHLSKNNFTDSNDSHVQVPSNSAFDYQSSVMLRDEAPNEESLLQNDSGGESEESSDLSSLLSQTTPPPIHDRDALEKDADLRKLLPWTVSPDSLGTMISYDFSSTGGFVDGVDDFVSSAPTEDQFPSALPSVESTTSIRLGSGAVAGIVIAVLICVTVITSTVIYLLYRRYNGKCTNVVEGKFNSDNCGYLDDSLRSSVYLNNHIELPKENSEEMSSLDNDSFLNSLETMTIQNYWADNTKNTKV